MPQVMILSMLVFFAVSVPVAVSIGLSSLLGVAVSGNLTWLVVAQQIYAALDKYPLVAVPFFILAGNLMEAGGISERMVEFAKSVVGGVQGGLACSCVLTCMIFAAVAGSSVATTFAVGAILIPAMVRHGYPAPFAASLQATAAELGVIIPPSIPLILFAVSTDTSTGELFIAGIGPGILIGLALMLYVWLYARRNGVGKLDGEGRMPLGRAFSHAWLALLMPVIILGGIYGGIFTPTEAAAVAMAYAFVLGCFVYRTLKMAQLMEIFRNSVLATAIIMLIIGNAGLLGWVLTAEKVPDLVAEWFVSISDSPLVFLLLVNLLLLLAGMFLETGAAIVITAPILTPVAIQFGIDPIHFGMIMIVNLAVGMVTPPVGVNLFVACQIAGIRIEQILKSMLPFYVVLLLDILIVTYWPQLSLWLPSLLK